MRVRPPRRRLAGVLTAVVTATVAAVLLAGCGSVYWDAGGEQPTGPLRCTQVPGEVDDPLLLVAQAVPTASFLPCLRTLPADWSVGSFDVRTGRAKIILSFLGQGLQGYTVELTRDCDPGRAVETASDQPGMRRYDRVVRDAARYSEDRFYTYPGGCAALRLRLEGPAAGKRAAEVADMIGFIGRDALDRQVREHSDGRLRLDPGGTG